MELRLSETKPLEAQELLQVLPREHFINEESAEGARESEAASELKAEQNEESTDRYSQLPGREGRDWLEGAYVSI